MKTFSRENKKNEGHLLSGGCIVKSELDNNHDVDHYYSRVSHDDFHWILKRKDREFAISQEKTPTFPIKYTDTFAYRKNYSTITRDDFFKKKR